MKNKTKLSELKTKRTELFESIKDLKHQITSELGNVHDRWCGYKVLKESSCEAEIQEWNGKEDDQSRKITGECFEVWHCIAEENANCMEKVAIEHARKAVTAHMKLEVVQRDLEQNWDDICKAEEEAKKEVKS